MNERSYMSIGEVLALLQDEYPDVTISKIRFLESQGLIDPERTPSGYRKFYSSDIDRLRFILREQKDRFLPLKVIKDRLDAGEAVTDTSATVIPLPTAGPAETGPIEERVPIWMTKHPAHASNPVA
ncbi:MAG TPA: MerR family transcriptional regulator, partial [Acidimicrobiales bacterium]